MQPPAYAWSAKYKIMPSALVIQRFSTVANRPILLLLCLISCVAASPVFAADVETNAVAQLLSMREFELKPGIKASDFERFVQGELMETVAKSVKGMKIKILKGDRGERKGGYILVWEFESVAARNQFFPREGGGSSPAFQEAWDHIKAVMGKFKSYTKDLSSYTDYVVVSR
jgi:hypothetical protein